MCAAADRYNVTREAHQHPPWQLSVQPSAVLRLHVSLMPDLSQASFCSCGMASTLAVHEPWSPAAAWVKCSILRTKPFTRVRDAADCQRSSLQSRSWLYHLHHTSRSQLPQRSGCQAPILE